MIKHTSLRQRKSQYTWHTGCRSDKSTPSVVGWVHPKYHEIRAIHWLIAANTDYIYSKRAVGLSIFKTASILIVQQYVSID